MKKFGFKHRIPPDLSGGDDASSSTERRQASPLLRNSGNRVTPIFVMFTALCATHFLHSLHYFHFLHFF
jgi:hypothetical protein